MYVYPNTSSGCGARDCATERSIAALRPSMLSSYGSRGLSVLCSRALRWKYLSSTFTGLAGTVGWTSVFGAGLFVRYQREPRIETGSWANEYEDAKMMRSNVREIKLISMTLNIALLVKPGNRF